MRREVIAATIARWAVGGTFVFSGLVKSVDPVGTSIFVDEYLAAYSLEGLGSLSLAAAVVLGAAELSVGVMRCRCRRGRRFSKMWYCCLWQCGHICVIAAIR